MSEGQVSYDVVERPIGEWERFYNNGAARKTVLLALLAAVWETYARSLDNPLLFPTFSATVSDLLSSIASGELPRAAWFTIA